MQRLTIPDYLSIKKYKEVVQLEHLTDKERMLESLYTLSDLSRDKVNEMPITTLSEVFEQVSNTLLDVEPEFYPIFVLDDIEYGYNDIFKMTLGEFVDLEQYLKDPINNLQKIMALCYRPIIKNSLTGFKFQYRKRIKIRDGEAENLFKYYKVEKYDSDNTLEREDKLGELPVSFALGLLAFISGVGMHCIASITPYSEEENQILETKQMEMLNQMTDMRSLLGAIGVGFRRLYNSLEVPSITSQENDLFWTTTSSSVFRTFRMSMTKLRRSKE